MSKQKITSPKWSQPQLLITFAVEQSWDGCQAWSKRREWGQREWFFFYSRFLCWQFESNYMRRMLWCETGCRRMWKKMLSSTHFLQGCLHFKVTIRGSKNKAENGGGKVTKSRKTRQTGCATLAHSVFLHFVFLAPFAGLDQSHTHQYWMSFISPQCGSCHSELQHTCAASRQTFTLLHHMLLCHQLSVLKSVAWCVFWHGEVFEHGGNCECPVQTTRYFELKNLCYHY